MKPTLEQCNDFLAHRPVPDVTFEHNDAVEVIGGEYAGDSGTLISVEELSKDPVYLVELDSGKDALISQSFLRLVEA